MRMSVQSTWGVVVIMYNWTRVSPIDSNMGTTVLNSDMDTTVFSVHKVECCCEGYI